MLQATVLASLHLFVVAVPPPLPPGCDNGGQGFAHEWRAQQQQAQPHFHLGQGFDQPAFPPPQPHHGGWPQPGLSHYGPAPNATYRNLGQPEQLFLTPNMAQGSNEWRGQVPPSPSHIEPRFAGPSHGGQGGHGGNGWPGQGQAQSWQLGWQPQQGPLQRFEPQQYGPPPNPMPAVRPPNPSWQTQPQLAFRQDEGLARMGPAQEMHLPAQPHHPQPQQRPRTMPSATSGGQRRFQTSPPPPPPPPPPPRPSHQAVPERRSVDDAERRRVEQQTDRQRQRFREHPRDRPAVEAGGRRDEDNSSTVRSRQRERRNDTPPPRNEPRLGISRRETLREAAAKRTQSNKSATNKHASSRGRRESKSDSSRRSPRRSKEQAGDRKEERSGQNEPRTSGACAGEAVQGKTTSKATTTSGSCSSTSTAASVVAVVAPAARGAAADQVTGEEQRPLVHERPTFDSMATRLRNSVLTRGFFRILSTWPMTAQFRSLTTQDRISSLEYLRWCRDLFLVFERYGAERSRTVIESAEITDTIRDGAWNQGQIFTAWLEYQRHLAAEAGTEPPGWVRAPALPPATAANDGDEGRTEMDVTGEGEVDV